MTPRHSSALAVTVLPKGEEVRNFKLNKCSKITFAYLHGLRAVAITRPRNGFWQARWQQWTDPGWATGAATQVSPQGLGGPRTSDIKPAGLPYPVVVTTTDVLKLVDERDVTSTPSVAVTTLCCAGWSPLSVLSLPS